MKEYHQQIHSRWLFPSPRKDDLPLDPASVRKHLTTILERAGCKHIRFHDLRHLFATMSLDHGMDIKSRLAKKLEYQDNCDRNTVEGVFGTVKTAYGLDRVMARLQETAICVIGVALLLSNLSRSLRVSLALLCLLFLLYCLPKLRSRP